MMWKRKKQCALFKYQYVQMPSFKPLCADLDGWEPQQTIIGPSRKNTIYSRTWTQHDPKSPPRTRFCKTLRQSFQEIHVRDKTLVGLLLMFKVKKIWKLNLNKKLYLGRSYDPSKWLVYNKCYYIVDRQGALWLHSILSSLYTFVKRVYLYNIFRVFYLFIFLLHF